TAAAAIALRIGRLRLVYGVDAIENLANRVLDLSQCRSVPAFWELSELETLLASSQMCPEERHRRAIELVVEGPAIEAWRICAQDRHCLGEFGRARGDKGEMGRIGCDPVVGAHREKRFQRVNCLWRHAIAAKR